VAAFPRTVPPSGVSYPKNVGSLISVGQSGAVQTRSVAGQGITWTETWSALLASSEDVQELLVTIQDLYNTGSTCTLTHYLLPGSGKDANGSGLGSPKVNGGGQSGTSLMTYGWTASETGVMKAGDCFTVPGCDVLFRVTADAASDGSGLATITIVPPILAGRSPTNSGALTIASANITAVVVDYTSASAGPAEYIGGLTVTFQESP
jgi:hypothetical protein